ncbi:MAG: hypothetical protein COA78_07160 [Blastopirellula sp.]|nr:MAG: hypothetical protein COA78_07160 [Blastopirellula sp.]
MGDMGDMYRDMTEYKKTKRASNTQSSTDILTKTGIPFSSKNGGAHLIVGSGELVADFWPSTGKWIVRKGKEGRGVFKLIKLMNAGVKKIPEPDKRKLYSGNKPPWDK